MIAYLEGNVLLVRKEKIVLKAGPIGYEVAVFNPSAYQTGQEAALYCYQQFREDGQTLYGFESNEQYELFVLLIQVKGLGCKTVMNMLARMDCQTIIKAIENGDVAALKKAPGIGAKTAGQIILDLKGKVVLEETSPKKEKKQAASPVFEEVAEALLSLGFKQNEIDSLQITPEMLANMSVSDLLQNCLKQLAARKRH